MSNTLNGEGVALRTPRMTLRPVAPGDAALFVELDSDPAVMRFLGRRMPAEHVESVLLPRLLDGGGRWIATDTATDLFLGWFALDPSREADERELGYRLRATAWGCGYGTEGARALVEHGFTDLGLRRIWARTMAVNTASRRVMERAGLRYLCSFRHEYDEVLQGSEKGDVEYELRREDWECTG